MASGASSPSSMAAPIASPAFMLTKFSIPISFKLVDDNFLLWQQEAIAAIKDHRLQSHLRKDLLSPMYLKDTDEVSSNPKPNPEFENWEQQDNVLLSWLLASLSEYVGVRMVGCVYSYKFGKRLRNFSLHRLVQRSLSSSFN